MATTTKTKGVRLMRVVGGWMALTSGISPRIATFGPTEEQALAALDREIEAWRMLLEDDEKA